MDPLRSIRPRALSPFSIPSLLTVCRARMLCAPDICPLARISFPFPFPWLISPFSILHFPICCSLMLLRLDGFGALEAVSLSSLCVISKPLVLDFMAWSDTSVERRSQVETGDRQHGRGRDPRPFLRAPGTSTSCLSEQLRQAHWNCRLSSDHFRWSVSCCELICADCKVSQGTRS